MANPAENRKRVRGYRRRVKQIEHWKQANLKLNMENFTTQGRDYVKIWLDPWSRLHKRNPPVWMRCILFSVLVEIYHSWERSLGETGEPYYLAVWLCEPRFYDSQVVAAKGDYIGFYNNSFNKSPEDAPIPDIYKAEAISIHSWETCIDEDYYYLAGDELTERELRQISKKRHKTSQVGDDMCYSVQAGYRWVGSSI